MQLNLNGRNALQSRLRRQREAEIEETLGEEPDSQSSELSDQWFTSAMSTAAGWAALQEIPSAGWNFVFPPLLDWSGLERCNTVDVHQKCSAEVSDFAEARRYYLLNRW